MKTIHVMNWSRSLSNRENNTRRIVRQYNELQFERCYFQDREEKVCGNWMKYYKHGLLFTVGFGEHFPPPPPLFMPLHICILVVRLTCQATDFWGEFLRLAGGKMNRWCFHLHSDGLSEPPCGDFQSHYAPFALRSVVQRVVQWGFSWRSPDLE